MCSFLRFHSESSGFSGELMLTKWHSFSCSVVESAFHQQTRICDNTAFRSFMRFQNLSEETRSHAAWNSIDLCFLTFLRNKSEQLLYPGWIISTFSEIITIDLHCFVWTSWLNIFKAQWTEIWAISWDFGTFCPP